MNKKTFLSALTATLLTAATTANATLESRLSGKAFYDTETDLTWAAPGYTLPDETFSDHLANLPTYTLGGISEWNIPTFSEFIIFALSHSEHKYDMLIPNPPLDFASFNPWYWTTGAAGSMDTYVYRLSTIESYPNEVVPAMKFKVWQVHHGDVPVIAVPEPQTYAMLLAGLGLMGFSLKNQTKISRVSA